ncbi:MAG: CoA transferase [Chloroflexi bacterium]|nr:CoA transferase [Chloroflexota bacterium]
MTGPLEGVRVLEFSEIVAGPLAGVLLSDLGAEVIKVEPPWGDPWRQGRLYGPGDERVFVGLNRGKRSITLDLTTPGGQEVAHRLAAEVDVITTNHRPDVPAKLGIDYETLRKINPRIIYCEVTAFGPEGPDSHLPGYDLVMQGYSGMVATQSKYSDGRLMPVVSTAPIDFATGQSITSSVSAALYFRERTGKGQKVSISLLAAALMAQTLTLTQIDDLPSGPQAFVRDELPLLKEASVPYADINAMYQDLRKNPAYSIYYRSYITSDSAVMIGALSNPLRKKFADEVGLHDPRFDEGYDTGTPEYSEVIKSLIATSEKILSESTTEEWITRFEKVGVACAPIRFVDEMHNNPQALANGLIIEQQHPVLGTYRTPGPISAMSESPPESGIASPMLGQHTNDILTEAGYSGDEIDGLRAAGALG